MAASDDDGNRFTLADANRNRLNHFDERLNELEEQFEERLSDLEAENTQLRREIAELKDGGEF